MRNTAYAWNPFAEFDVLRRGFDRLFEGAILRDDVAKALASVAPANAFPFMNVREDRDAIHVQALVAGAAPESLNVTVKGAQLQVTGEKPAVDATGAAVHRAERIAGRFTRVVELPSEVDSDKTTAEYRDGVLRIVLPKAESAKPREIAVKVG